MQPYSNVQSESAIANSDKRLVLYLSGRWKAEYGDAFEDGDELYCAPGFSTYAPDIEWKELSRFPYATSEALAERYSDLLFSNQQDLTRNVENALANAQFYYGVLPMAAQLQDIDRLISEIRPKSVIVISSRTGVRHIPTIGIVTTESNRGSPNLLGSLVANVILEAKLNIPVQRIAARGDALNLSCIRNLALHITTICLMLVAAFRIVVSRIRSCKKVDHDYAALVCLRSAGQAQHAARIFAGASQAAALVIPQFTGRNKLREVELSLSKRVSLFRPAASDVLYALLRSIFYSASLKGRRSHPLERLNVGRFSMPIGKGHLLLELGLSRHLVFYKILVERSVSRFGGQLRKLVGFEIKGPIASIEAMAGRTCRLETISIQSVLVQPRPLPIFPWPDCFYADSRATSELIKQTGRRQPGKVTFVGSPHAVVPLKQNPAISSAVFMTQPYESAQTLALLRLLCKAARKFGFRVRIRLHPRDRIDNYARLLITDKDVLEVCRENSLSKAISSADLCITRVSSTAKEALALGTPIMICLCSEVDRAVEADYIANDHLAEHYIATNEAMVMKIASNFNHLIAANKELHSRLFNDQGIEMLRNAVLGTE